MKPGYQIVTYLNEVFCQFIRYLPPTVVGKQLMSMPATNKHASFQLFYSEENWQPKSQQIEGKDLDLAETWHAY